MDDAFAVSEDREFSVRPGRLPRFSWLFRVPSALSWCGVRALRFSGEPRPLSVCEASGCELLFDWLFGTAGGGEFSVFETERSTGDGLQRGCFGMRMLTPTSFSMFTFGRREVEDDEFRRLGRRLGRTEFIYRLYITISGFRDWSREESYIFISSWIIFNESRSSDFALVLD